MTVLPCPHGIAFAEECLDCKIDWYRDCLRDAQRRINSCIATYDPTGTDPEPPWPVRQRQWKRSLKWLAIAVGFVVSVLMVTAL